MMKKALFFTALLCSPLVFMGCYHNDVATPNHAPTGMTRPLVDELYDYDWRLIASDDVLFEPFIHEHSVHLAVSKKGLGFSAGCNFYAANFTIIKDILSIDDGVIATRKACDLKMHDAEQALVRSFKNAKLSVSTKSNETAIMTHVHQDKTWVWQGTKKADVQYGKPVMLYWEIAPKMILCANNTVSCLKIRNVRYDEQGIKTGAGAWREFDGFIQGYHHEMGVSKIIRLKAYTDKSTGQIIHVYDGTIEQGLAE